MLSPALVIYSLLTMTSVPRPAPFDYLARGTARKNVEEMIDAYKCAKLFPEALIGVSAVPRGSSSPRLSFIDT